MQGVAGLIPGWGAKISHAWQPEKQNLKKKQFCNKFNKDFKNGPHQKKKKKKVFTNKEGLPQNQGRNSLPNSPVYECHQCPGEENWW